MLAGFVTSEERHDEGAEEIAAALSSTTPPPLERRDVPHGGRPQAVACTAESVLSPTECERLIAITEAQGYEKALVNVGGGRQMAIDDVRKSGRCMIDAPEAAELIWKRVAPLLPAEKGREDITNGAPSASTSGCAS